MVNISLGFITLINPFKGKTFPQNTHAGSIMLVYVVSDFVCQYVYVLVVLAPLLEA